MLWWLWILAGLVLLAMELLTPGGFFVIFFGFGACLVGAAVGLGLVQTIWLQWLLFSVISIVLMLFLRRPLLEWMKRREPVRAPVDSFVGEIAVLTEDLAPGGIGKAELRGTSWSVRSRAGEAMARGRRCRVEEVEGLTLWVRAD